MIDENEMARLTVGVLLERPGVDLIVVGPAAVDAHGNAYFLIVSGRTAPPSYASLNKVVDSALPSIDPVRDGVLAALMLTPGVKVMDTADAERMATAAISAWPKVKNTLLSAMDLLHAETPPKHAPTHPAPPRMQ